jgi:tRNA A22 N-methylase
MPFIMKSYQVTSCVNVDVVSDVYETAIITETVSETSDTNVITSMPNDGDRDSL